MILLYDEELDEKAPSRDSTGAGRFPWLAAVGLVLTGAGGAVEFVWWLANGPTWANLYLFLGAGAPFWWTVALHIAGGIVTETHWRTAPEGKWWALLGRVLAIAWTIRVTLGVVLLLLQWVLKNHGSDLIDATSSKKRRSRRRRRRRYR